MTATTTSPAPPMAILPDNTSFSGTEGIYMLPHHAKEIDRLTRQHRLMLSTTESLLLASNITAGDKPLRILDAGCADGTWLRSIKAQYPDRKLELYGIDIGSSLFPSEAEQKRSDIELRSHSILKPFPTHWKWTDSFDVVHQRLLVWGLKSEAWPIVIKNYLNIIKPGGYLQLVEIEFISKRYPAKNDRPQLQKQAEMQKWSTTMFGMDIDVAYKLEDWLSSAGFENVHKLQFDHGYGALARDPAQGDVSAELWVECFRTLDAKIPVDGMPGVARDSVDFHDFLDKLEIEVKQYGYQPKLNFVFGRKPSSSL